MLKILQRLITKAIFYFRRFVFVLLKYVRPLKCTLDIPAAFMNAYSHIFGFVKTVIIINLALFPKNENAELKFLFIVR